MSKRSADDAVEAGANLTAEAYLNFCSIAITKKQKMEELHAEFKSAQGEYRAHLKHGKKNLGIDLDAHDEVEKRRAMDPEAAALLEKNIARYRRFRGLPVGTQVELFSTDEAPITDKAADEARHVAALEVGYVRGVAGDSSEDNPHQPGSPEYAGWDRGWRRGNRFHKKGVASGRGAISRPAGRQSAAGNLEDGDSAA